MVAERDAIEQPGVETDLLKQKRMLSTLGDQVYSFFLYTLADEYSIGYPDEVDIGDDDIDPDAILDADQCDFHTVWATMDGDNYDVARRNGVLVEN